MPSKRSRSKEREKKQNAREKRSKEQVEKEREASRRSMKLLRESRDEVHTLEENKIEDKDWYAKIMERAKVTMKEKRAKQNQDEKEEEKIDLRLRVRNLRANKTEEEKEYGKLCKKHKMRESRAQRSGKDHLLENLRAKKGMKLLKEKGRLRDFESRATDNDTEMLDWKDFMKKGKAFSDLITKAKPDLVERLNQEIREEKEKDRKRKEEEKKEEKEDQWHYIAEYDDYVWVGEGEPDYGDSFSYSPLNEDEKKLQREAERKECEDFIEERKKNLKEKRRLKQIERKEAMAIALDPLPERELCPYEKLREDIIKEREKAMVESGFFEDLLKTKRDMGLLN